MDRRGIHWGDAVESGRVMIDGAGGEGVESAVLRDRRSLSESGIVVITAGITPWGDLSVLPEIVTKGFVYVKENEELLQYLADMARKFLSKSLDKGMNDPQALGARLKDDMANIICQKTRRKPMVVTNIFVTEL